MEILNTYILITSSVLDAFIIGCASGFCPCFKKKFKMFYFSILLCLINFFMFVSGGLISLTTSKSGVLSSYSVYRYFILFIFLKFIYDAFFNKEKIDKLKISFLIIIISGLDCFGAGFVVDKNYISLSIFLIIFLSFGFTMSGFYVSKILIYAKRNFNNNLNLRN